MDRNASNDLQLTRYIELRLLIEAARDRDEDFILRGARQIALYRWKDERKFRRVYGKETYPYAVHGSIFHLSVQTAERWEQYLEYCKLRRIDPLREIEKFGFGPPREDKPRRLERSLPNGLNGQ